MARITLVNKARKDQGTCESCREPIPAGSSYRWCAPGGIGARKRKRHASCPVWRPSELSSSKMVPVWAAVEDAEEALGGVHASDYISTEGLDEPEFDSSGYIDAVRSIVEEVASSCEEVASDYQDGIDALPEQLQYGPTAEESQEKISALEDFQSACEGFDPSDDWDPPSRESVEAPDVDDAEVDDRFLDEFTSAAEEWAQSVVDEAESVLGEFSY